MITVTLSYKQPAATIGCLNLYKVRQVTSREIPVIVEWIQNLTAVTDCDSAKLMDFLNDLMATVFILNEDYYLDKQDSCLYVHRVDCEPVIEETKY